LYASESPLAIAQHNATYVALSAALVHFGNDPVMFNAELAHGAHGSVTFGATVIVCTDAYEMGVEPNVGPQLGVIRIMIDLQENFATD
jgi:hypothetical protein